jgi:hypothetical protein
MEKVNQLKLLMEKLSTDSQKVFLKNNRLAGKRARKTLLEIENIITPLRKEILNKMKTIPVKKKIK